MIIEDTEFALTDLIVPGATLLAALLGALVAYWFHRRNERKQIKRQKAEELVGLLLKVEQKFNLKYPSDHPRWPSDIVVAEKVNELLNSIEVLSLGYFPKFSFTADDEKHTKKTVDNLVTEISLLKGFTETYVFMNKNISLMKAASEEKGKKSSLKEHEDIVIGYTTTAHESLIGYKKELLQYIHENH